MTLCKAKHHHLQSAEQKLAFKNCLDIPFCRLFMFSTWIFVLLYKFAGGVSHPSLLDTLPFEQLAGHVTKSHFMFCFCLCVLIVLDTGIGNSLMQESRGYSGIIGSQPCC